MTDTKELCPTCHPPDDNTCDSCDNEFDNWSISYTTYQCPDCGGVYQEEYRMCKQCAEEKGMYV